MENNNNNNNNNNNKVNSSSNATAVAVNTTSQTSNIADVIVKSIEEVALNGALGMTPKELWIILQTDAKAFTLNQYTKQYIHTALLNDPQISIASLSDDVPTPTIAAAPQQQTQTEPQAQTQSRQLQIQTQTQTQTQQGSTLPSPDTTPITIEQDNAVLATATSVQSLAPFGGLTSSVWMRQNQETQSSEPKHLNKADYPQLSLCEDTIRYVANDDLRMMSFGVKGTGIQLNILHIKIISFIAIKRHYGCIQRDITEQLRMDARNIFHPIKFLITRGLVKKISVYQRRNASSNSGQSAINSNVLYLTRFFEKRLIPPTWKLIKSLPETICGILAKQPNREMPYNDLQKTLLEGGEDDISATTLKKFRKELEDQGYIESFASTTKARGITLRLKRPYKSEEEKPDEEDEDDEDNDQLPISAPQSRLVMERPLLDQIHMYIKKAGESGVTMMDIRTWVGFISSKHVFTGVRALILYYNLKVIPTVQGKQMTYRLVAGNGAPVNTAVPAITGFQAPTSRKAKPPPPPKEKKKQGRPRKDAQDDKAKTDSKDKDEAETEPKKQDQLTLQQDESSGSMVIVQDKPVEQSQSQPESQALPQPQQELVVQPEPVVPTTPTKAVVHGRKTLPRTTLYMAREKFVTERIQEQKGVLFLVLQDQLSKFDDKTDQKTLKHLLNEMEKEGKIKLISLYMPTIDNAKNVLFIMDSKYSVQDQVIKDVITEARSIRNKLGVSEPTVQKDEESQKNVKSADLNQTAQIAQGYGMIAGLFLRIKYFHFLLWTYCMELTKKNQATQAATQSSSEPALLPDTVVEFPAEITIYQNAFLNNCPVDDYLKCFPQYYVVEHLDDHIASRTILSALPREIRMELFKRGYLTRVSQLTKIMKMLGLVVPTVEGHYVRLTIKRDVQLDEKTYCFSTLETITEYWTDLQYIGLTNEVHSLGKNMPMIQNTALWGFVTGISRVKRSTIYTKFRREPPMTKAELIEVAVTEKVRLSKVESLYKNYLKKINDKSNRIMLDYDTKMAKRRKQKTLASRPGRRAGTVEPRPNRWTHEEDIRLLNVALAIFAPFLQSLTKRPTQPLVSIYGVPAIIHPDWQKVAKTIDRSVPHCHRRIKTLVTKYSSFRIQFQSLLKFRKVQAQFDLPESMEVFDSILEFNEYKCFDDVIQYCHFDNVEQSLIKEKLLYQVMLSDDEFSSKFGQELVPSTNKELVVDVMAQMTRDRIIHPVLKQKSKRFVLGKREPIYKLACVDGAFFFGENEEFLSVVKNNVHFDRLDDADLFHFEPHNSGGSVSQCLQLMHRGKFTPAIDIRQERDLFRAKGTRSVVGEPRIDNFLCKFISLSYVLSEFIDRSYLKRVFIDEGIGMDEEETELLNEFESQRKYVKLLTEFEDPSSQQQQMQDDEDMDKDTNNRTPVLDLIRTYQVRLELDELKTMFYQRTVNANVDDFDDIYDNLAMMERVYKMIVNSKEAGMTKKSIVNEIAYNGYNSDESLEYFEHDEDLLEQVIDQLPRFTSELLAMKLIQVVYGYSEKIYVATQFVEQSMLPLDPARPLQEKTLIRPWVAQDGSVVHDIFNQLVYEIIIRIMENPGITLERLAYKTRFSTPSFISEVVQILARLDFVSIKCYAYKPATLFTESSYQLLPYSSVDASLRLPPDQYDSKQTLNQIYNPTENIINLPSDFSDFIHMIEL
ncbi:hypothetical protein SAMD00019534_060270 [Acytostelium subglobosum LB1]|uniref:hypothetical protein n=1 Tax=Acytostelium subglobosum LB1 TaxID=1410327 RepID=UPI000644880A|nr:hypothetical protein SAMD00019534_060270 [Acytostelium subglobosum LB1]GAM22852.1 hypothetical protein SAMD00019534_060270 [Acytostelium subglobosum LB1]|eukprot:XP_012754079.1 hypothetical protein SAMD00019534_060270 [Acytostelium subglobosum LB1]